MKKLLEKYQVFVFFIMTILVFFILLIVTRWAWSQNSITQPDTDFWAMCEALATLLATSAVLVGGFVAIKELDEISNSRHLEVANQLFAELNSDENIEARRLIFQELPDDPATHIESLSPDLKDAMKRVLNSLDHVAFLTRNEWINPDIIMPWMHPMITKSWAKLGPYVALERQRRNEPYYYQFAEKIARDSITWRKKNIPDSEVINWIDKAL